MIKVKFSLVLISILVSQMAVSQNYAREIQTYLDTIHTETIEKEMLFGTWNTDSGYVSEYLTLLADGKCKLSVPGDWDGPGKLIDGTWQLFESLLSVQTPKKDLKIFVRVINGIPEMLAPLKLMEVKALYWDGIIVKDDLERYLEKSWVRKE